MSISDDNKLSPNMAAAVSYNVSSSNHCSDTKDDVVLRLLASAGGSDVWNNVDAPPCQSTSTPSDQLTLPCVDNLTCSAFLIEPVIQYPLWHVTFFGLLAVAIGFLTISGNLIVILSFVLERAIRQPTNYFIASLAVSDLLIGTVSMPFYTVYLLSGKYWPLGEALCDLWLSVDYTACLCSIYTVFCITADRYCSVKLPASYRKWRTERKVAIIVSLTWIIPAAVFFPSIFGWQYFVGRRTVPAGKCYVQYMEDALFNCLLQVGYFWITLVAMITLYVGIYRVALGLHRRSVAQRERSIACLVSMAGGTVTQIGSVIGMSRGPARPNGRSNHAGCPGVPLGVSTGSSGPGTVADPTAGMPGFRFDFLARAFANRPPPTDTAGSGPVADRTDPHQDHSDPGSPADDDALLSPTAAPISQLGVQQRFVMSDYLYAIAKSDEDDSDRSYRTTLQSDSLPSTVSPKPIAFNPFAAPSRPDGNRDGPEAARPTSPRRPSSSLLAPPPARSCVGQRLNHVARGPRTTSLSSSSGYGSKPELPTAERRTHIAKLPPPPPTAAAINIGDDVQSNFDRHSRSAIDNDMRDFLHDFTRVSVVSVDDDDDGAERRRTNSDGKAATAVTSRPEDLHDLPYFDDDEAEADEDYYHDRSGCLSPAYCRHGSSSSDVFVDRRRPDDRSVTFATDVDHEKRRQGTQDGRATEQIEMTSACEWNGGVANGGRLTSQSPGVDDTTRSATTSRSWKFVVVQHQEGRRQAESRLEQTHECEERQALLRASCPRHGEAERKRLQQLTRNDNRTRKALRTITIILGAFVVCWIPWHILSLIIGFTCHQRPYCPVAPTLYDISYWLCYLNSPINPFCYAFANQQFKKAFIRIIRLDWRRS